MAIARCSLLLVAYLVMVWYLWRKSPLA